MKENEEKKNTKKELNDEELKKANGGVMVEAYEVLATGVAKLTSIIYRWFN